MHSGKQSPLNVLMACLLLLILNGFPFGIRCDEAAVRSQAGKCSQRLQNMFISLSGFSRMEF